MSTPLVSVLVNNYNYGRFLGDAIESALRQDYPSIEVVVVDDGSSDNSRDVIAAYAGRIVPVLKENGGQASAFNAGVAASHGEILCFLDADDLFHPGKVGRVVEAFRERGLNSRPMLVHHLLALENETGESVDEPPLGKVHPSPLNLHAFAERHRFLLYEAGPTSTLSINRRLADRLFPLPEKEVRISADDFIVLGASLLFEINSLAEALGTYRVHGGNRWYRASRRKPPAFERALEGYLNGKLAENGLAPVISFDRSMRGWWGPLEDGQWARLCWLMLACCFRDRDRYTYVMTYHVVVTLGMRVMKTLRRKRDGFVKLIGGKLRRDTCGIHISHE